MQQELRAGSSYQGLPHSPLLHATICDCILTFKKRHSTAQSLDVACAAMLGLLEGCQTLVSVTSNIDTFMTANSTPLMPMLSYRQLHNTSPPLQDPQSHTGWWLARCLPQLQLLQQHLSTILVCVLGAAQRWQCCGNAAPPSAAYPYHHLRHAEQIQPSSCSNESRST